MTVGDVNDIIETAIGGKTITTTVEKRERYPVNVRYARDFREDLDALKRVLVALPMSVEFGASERMNASTLSRSDALTLRRSSQLGFPSRVTVNCGPGSFTEGGRRGMPRRWHSRT